MPEPLETVSAVDALAASLRDRVLGGRYPPDTKLPETEVAADYGVSRPTAKGAITVLVQEGLLRRAANRPAQVPRLDRADIEDIFLVRIPLELTVVKFLVAHRRRPVNAAAAINWLRTTPPEDVVQAAEADLSFHERLVEAVGSRRLSRLYHGIQAEIRLTIVQIHQAMGPERYADEHQGVLEALEAFDEHTALERMRSHLEGARTTLVEYVRT